MFSFIHEFFALNAFLKGEYVVVMFHSKKIFIYNGFIFGV